MSYPMMPPEDDGPCLCNPCVCDHNCGLRLSRISGDQSAYPEDDEYEGEGEGDVIDDTICQCDPCECETPPGSPEKLASPVPEEADEEGAGDGNAYQLDEFSRAKAYFLANSGKSGLSLYEHLVQVIRKLLDERGPTNPVDYFEEVSMNVKRYKFQGPKDILRDVFQISEPLLNDARYLTDHWKKFNKWSDPSKIGDEENSETVGYVGGSFQNLLRLAYYLEQVNIGLPREEMFRLALAIRELTANRSFISRARFWGKIFGIRQNYYVVETDLQSPGSGDTDLWQSEEETVVEVSPQNGEPLAEVLSSEEKVPGPQQTLERAGNVVLDTDILSAYAKTSGLPPEKQAELFPKPKSLPPPKVMTEYGGEDYEVGEQMLQLEDSEATADYAKWQGYMEELMTGFPGAGKQEQEIIIAPEADGVGLNRRAYYVCNYLGGPWILLPPITPQQVNRSRQIRWCLTGELSSEIRTYPIYPGKEVHYLKALLARAAAGSLVSPKGFYKASKYTGEFDGEDDEEFDGEEEPINAPGDDKVLQTKKYEASIKNLSDPSFSFWVHHAAYILPQGRGTWWNPVRGDRPQRKRNADETSDEETDLESEYDEYEGEDASTLGREIGPPLFSSIGNDKAADGRNPWTLQTATSIFTEFQVVSVRSNTWPGSNCICTVKGKVDNIYFGDGLKFAERTYSPPAPEQVCTEYKVGPEIGEISDPSVEEEQEWLNRLELNQKAKIDADENLADNEDSIEEYEESDDEY